MHELTRLDEAAGAQLVNFSSGERSDFPHCTQIALKKKYLIAIENSLCTGLFAVRYPVDYRRGGESATSFDTDTL
jgi:hypothetical protein